MCRVCPTEAAGHNQDVGATSKAPESNRKFLTMIPHIGSVPQL